MTQGHVITFRLDLGPGHGSSAVPPEVIPKMMFLLFFDDIKSERELMEVIGERLDYLWFLDYGLDQKIPDYSVLSKARARWEPAGTSGDTLGAFDREERGEN